MDKRETIPLYEHIRPRSLKEFVGQKHLRPKLRTFLKAKSPPSILFFGPPGSGKTTLARILANNFSKNIIHLSAPQTGIATLKKLVDRYDILILDEIHRFSKAQQDFFLPLLEKGDIILFATTTENPSFSITRQLLSRLYVLSFCPLNPEELFIIGMRGAEEIGKEISEDTMKFLVGICGGDARTLLNIVEFCGRLEEEDLSPERLKKLLPSMVHKGDRTGDTHYELASALIKSIRGSDPDAALYYLGAMLESGEDPEFICRRLIISASEDIGLADPRALTLAVSCAQAIEKIGMPEGFIPLAETVVYLSLAPKSNSTYQAYLEVKKEIQKHGIKPVPLHLKNPSSRLHREWGYGVSYKYPHSYPGSWVEQQYLPDEIKAKRFYRPRREGVEPSLLSWLKDKKKY